METQNFTPWELDFYSKLDAYCERFKPKIAAADVLGIPEATLNSYLYRIRRPKYSSAERILTAMGETPMPFTDRPPVINGVDNLMPGEEIEGENLPTIPVHSIAGAGQERDFWSEDPQRKIPILPQYYRKDMVGVMIDGNSMEPTIMDGAIVGVVPVTELAEGKIYLVRRPPFGLLVKRIRMNEKGELVLVSDNPQYPPQVVPYEGYDDLIIGRVIWCWQNL